MSEQQTAYALLGGAEPLQRIVARFYAQMSADPRFLALRQTHAGPLERAEQRLFMFLSGRLGGPDLYIEAFGHPRLRMRHLPFAIGPTERDQWVLCMDEAMRAEGVDEPLRAALTEFFTAVAAQMQNREA